VLNYSKLIVSEHGKVVFDSFSRKMVPLRFGEIVRFGSVSFVPRVSGSTVGSAFWEFRAFGSVLCVLGAVATPLVPRATITFDAAALRGADVLVIDSGTHANGGAPRTAATAIGTLV